MDPKQAAVVLITAGSEEEAERIAEGAVSERLVACVNIVHPVRSVFRWEGKLQRETEALLIMKTNRDHVPALIRWVEAAHSYDVPEVIVLPIEAGAERYLAWLDQETRRPEKDRS